MKVLLVLTALVAAASAVRFMELVIEEWKTFKTTHNKTYNNNVEDKFRMKIFIENRIAIAQHNAKYARGEVSYALEANHLSDLLNHEFVDLMNGFNRTARKGQFQNFFYQRKIQSSTFIPSANVVLPSSVDWRKKGAVTPVKNQGKCGSCYSFSATGSLEAQHFLKTGKLVSLSEQNIIDCSTGYGNHGCEGGLIDYAFSYVKDNHGIDTEKAYPYEAMDETCHYNPNFIGASATGLVDIPKGDEEALKKAVATIGPVSVAIDASSQNFQLYKNGVYYDESCSSDNLDHGVLVVGYGTDEKGTDYWLVKNSWGRQWGEEGYIRMARNRDNNCGIATCASYPMV